MEQQRWQLGPLGPLSLLSHFTIRRGKKEGENKRRWKTQRELWEDHKDLMCQLSFIALKVARGVSAWDTIAGLVWTCLETCQVHFLPFLQLKLLTPIYSFQFHHTFIHPVPINLAHGWWGKLRSGKKRIIRTYVFMTLPLLLHLPVYYQPGGHSV